MLRFRQFVVIVMIDILKNSRIGFLHATQGFFLVQGLQLQFDGRGRPILNRARLLIERFPRSFENRVWSC